MEVVGRLYFPVAGLLFVHLRQFEQLPPSFAHLLPLSAPWSVGALLRRLLNFALTADSGVRRQSSAGRRGVELSSCRRGVETVLATTQELL